MSPPIPPDAPARHGPDSGAGAPLLARERVAAGRTEHAGVDAALALATLLTGGLTLLVLAGIPAAGSAPADAARGLTLLGFWLIAPGAAVVTRLRLAPATTVAVTPLVGLAVLTALATVGTWAGLWLPRSATALVALAAVAVTVLDLAKGRIRLPGARRGPSRTGRTTVLALGLLAAVGLWAASLPAIGDAPPSVLGLLVAGPWTFPASLLGTVAVLLGALRGQHLRLAGAAVLALVVVLRATASVASPVPTSSWTYKHLGVVQALQENHHVTAGTDIYMNWPGMFAAGAWFSDASGVAVIDLARWITPVVHVLLALGTAALARALGAPAAGCTAAAALVVVLNWVGQDYFAPQAVAMCLAAGVVVLLVQSSASRACALLALGLFAAIVPTHQLTPFWLLIVAGALVVLRRAPWWLAAAMGLVVLAYILSRLEVAQAYGLFSGFDPVANAASSVPPVPATGRDVGGFFAKASSLLMWAATLAVLAGRAVRLGWWRGWRSREVLVPAAVAFSPFLLLAAQSYGGEATLRVALFSVLGCSAVLGPALAHALRRRVLIAAAAAAWTVVVAASTAQSSYTLWSVNLIRPEDVAAARWLVARDPDAVVVPVIAVWPGRTSVDYDRYIQPFTTLETGLDEMLRWQSRLATTSSIPLSPADVTEVAQLHPEKSTYVVFTENMRQYDAYYAEYVPGSYASTLRGLVASPEWEVVRHEGGLWILRYHGPAA